VISYNYHDVLKRNENPLYAPETYIDLGDIIDIIKDRETYICEYLKGHLINKVDFFYVNQANNNNYFDIVPFERNDNNIYFINFNGLKYGSECVLIYFDNENKEIKIPIQVKECKY
jgi:hypothetical protein